MNEEMAEQVDKIAEMFLKSLEQALPGWKAHVTYSVFKDDETEVSGGYKNSKGLTLKTAAFMQCVNIAQQFISSDELDD